MPRQVTFLYGVLCYAVFLAVFVYAIGFIGGFVTPTALDATPTRPLGEALAIDVGLLSLFALQHSGMARPAFKRWWTRIVPAAAERSTYVLVSSLLLVALFAWWQPIGGTVWETHGWARGLVLAIYALGWGVLFYSTCLIDHFDLFGLRQVWLRLGDAPYEAPKFYTPSLYKLVRHPLYVGWLMIFWAAPKMTAAHLLFALMTTAYILVAIQLEERDLAKAFPGDYPAYRSRTPMLIPRLTRWPAAPSARAQKTIP